MARGFGSDNHSGIHPKLLQALSSANVGHAPSYGTDPLTLEVASLLKDTLGPDAETFFVFNGTGANVIALQLSIKSYEAVLATDCAHLIVDECGAPEFHTGGKMIPVAQHHGKMDLSDAARHLIRKGDQHYSQPRALSITQPTELGTVYSLEEMRAIRTFCTQHSLRLHVDGTRLAQAAFFLDCDFKTIVRELEPDTLAFGGTKNGMLGTEALVVFDSAFRESAKFYRKQSLQLASKSRFHAAQFKAYLENNLWREIASHNHAMAQLLRDQLETVSEISIVYPVQSNAVFAKIPKSWISALKRAAFFYVWDESDWTVRLMTTFDTQTEDIDRFVAAARSLSQEDRRP